MPLRTSDEIAIRSLALYAAIAAAHGVPASDLTEWLNKENLWEELTPRELRFLTQTEPPEKEKIWMTWFAEAEFTLLWAIGKIERLPPPTSKCDTDIIISAIPLWQPTAPFIRSAALKEADVNEEAERIYDIRVEIGKAQRREASLSNEYNKDTWHFFGITPLIGILATVSSHGTRSLRTSNHPLHSTPRMHSGKY